MLSVQVAEAKILALSHPLDATLDIERVDLLAAHGRILATDIRGDLDFPYWDNSAMDGYAVRQADLQGCSPQQPVALRVVMEVPAGHLPQQKLQAGEAARIYTGAMLPVGADTVVMQEQAQRQNNQVWFQHCPEPQAFVRHRGAYYQAGNLLLTPGTMIAAPEIAVLASVQCTQIQVYRRLQVALFSTGNELVAPEESIKPGQIVDSNQFALAALVRQAGAQVQRLGIVGDGLAEVKGAIAQAIAQADVVISSGGVSVGDYDYVDQALSELGANIHIRSVAVKPGKPLTVATFAPTSERPHSVLYFGLPGNPVSALASFWRFVQPSLGKLSGRMAPWQPSSILATTEHVLVADGQRETYLWGHLRLQDGHYRFSLAGGSHSSGNLINLAGCNSFAIVPCGCTQISRGAGVQVLPISTNSPGLWSP
ncbi:molybdopterin molybdenumtransferase MoeA [Synechococcales cyanobacterium C]|uniref:Molybdopterin molybdenumtransferase n=1 Tax=Petrachloros mirabilis ULC683 TaxID=2781853 RepID=A0A8K2A8B1_9CYAN|nr:gephyrin-like molybdotransferase Glp [Petrachloros mirabilis]NCJ07029.1 molybdopterin molybdenumtransferase MoeA [Petrachloros mirabilis ULC683]